MRKLAVLAVVVALVVVAAIVLVRSRRPATTTSSPSSSQPSGSSTAVANKAEARTFPKTSEELVAAALQAKEISYEQSLLARAYALYDDPRLPKEFRSPVIDWEAGMALSAEINEKEATLSNEILKQLAPFRVRPNDPISIFNRPRAEVLKAQTSPVTGWVSRAVPGTRLRVWINGTQPQLDRYVPLLETAWNGMRDYFPHPLPDAGGKAPSDVDPDAAIDVYLVRATQIDPRSERCWSGQLNLRDCMLLGVLGRTEITAPSGRISSAYILLNIENRSDDQLLGTMAHELAHATQNKYDNREIQFDGGKWLAEGTAAWVEYKVLKHLGKIPAGPYEFLEVPAYPLGIFDNLHRSLDDRYHFYGTWLFFFSASIDLGDRVVTTVWEKAALQQFDGMGAVNAAIPMLKNFPPFAVRNWNRNYVPRWYKSYDDTFRTDVTPLYDDVIDPLPPIKELEAPIEPLPHLATAYFPFVFPPSIRRVTFENLYMDLPDARVWAIQKIAGGWREPEDWTEQLLKTFCRDLDDQNLEELILVVSNTHLTDPLAPGHPKPRVLSEENGCPLLEGWAQTTLRVKDDGQDATYASNRVQLKFRPRANQDQAGNVQYDLEPTSVTWTASGRVGDCTLSGAATMTIGGPLSVGSNGSGYMNVVGLDGGDFHSIVIVAAPMNPIKKTCPGPRVTNAYVPAGVLLQILSEPNRVENGEAIYKGQQTLDFANPFANLPAIPGAPSGAPRLPNMPDIPGVAEALKGMAGRNTVYTFQWELKPKNGALPPAGGTPFK